MNNLARCAVFVLLVAGAAAAYSNVDSKQIDIPRASKTVSVDGVMNEEEWSDALRQELVGGGELLLKDEGSHLCVGMRGLKKGWGHVYVWGADAVYVFHASAALGTAIYRKGDKEMWNADQSFSWAMRGTTQSTEGQETFLKSNHWLANNNSMGNSRELEFKVARDILTGDPRIAVVYASNANSPQFWPNTIKDDCLKQELVFGNTPSGLQFDKNAWARLAFKSAK